MFKDWSARGKAYIQDESYRLNMGTGEYVLLFPCTLYTAPAACAGLWLLFRWFVV